MLEWLIIGGGIHGVAHALSFIRIHRLSHTQLGILDPHPQLLGRWKHITTNVGMGHLRSPGVHHLHSDPFNLRIFAQTIHTAHHAPIPLYERPALSLFNAHSDSLIARFGADKSHIIGYANGMERLADGWRIHTDQHPIDTKRMLLAIGASDMPHIPTWAVGSAHIHHILDENFTRARITQGDWLVIGGGISAVQTALALADDGMRVTLISNHRLRIHDFDSDPCWVTRLCLADFHATSDLVARREMIRQARHKGSVPYDIINALDDAVSMGKIRHVITHIVAREDAPFHLITADGEQFFADGALLATGYVTSPPIPTWLADAIARYDLPLAPCGYPVVDKALCWSDGLYVTGALAELEIGATARNIIGARLATERLRHS